MPSFREIILPVVTAIVRNLLQAFFGYLIAHRWVEAQPAHQDALALYIIGFLAVVWWSVWLRLRHWLEKRLALALPSGSSGEELKAAVQNNSIWTALLGALRSNVPIAKP